jgi:hypothetical protein
MKQTRIYRSVIGLLLATLVCALPKAAYADDATPPSTAVVFTPAAVDLGIPYISNTTHVTLSATDFGSPPSGVAYSLYFIDGNSFMYTEPFMVDTEGFHTFLYMSQDNAGNMEDLQFTFFVVDATPPTTQLKYDTTTMVTTTTVFSLEAADPESGGFTSGLQQTYVALDGGAFAPYTNYFHFNTSGVHQIRFYSVDTVGNMEVVQTVSVQVYADTVPPVTTLTFSPPAVDVGGIPFISSSTLEILNATDYGTPTTGVAFTQYFIDGVVSNYLGAFKITDEGFHTLVYFSQDNASNAEDVQFNFLVVDATPPTTQLTYDASTVVTTATLFSLDAVDPSPGGFASGVQQTFRSLDGGGFTANAGPFIIPLGGMHTIRWYSRDAVGNTESIQSASVEIHVDSVAPVTVLSYSAAPYISGGLPYLSTSTTVILSATDTGIPTSGVAFSQYALEGAAFTTYSTPFVLSEGLHTLDYRSQDNAGNIETGQTATVAVDATSPITTLVYNAVPMITTSTVFTLSSQDPVSNGVTSGVHLTYLSTDGSAFAAYTGAFLLTSSGTHTLQWYTQDNVGNTEATTGASVEVHVDTVAPVTALSYSVVPYVSGGLPYLSTSTTLLLSSTDSGIPTSGVAFTQYALESNSWVAYTAPFSLMEGLHTIRYQSQDNAGNLESVNSVAVAVDATAPVTHLIYDASALVTTTTVFSLEAQDPVTQNVVSGVQLSYLALDGGTFTAYSAPFHFSAGGLHTIQWYSVDNVGNRESVQSASVQVYVDTTSPVTSLSYAPMAVNVGGVPFITSSTVVVLSAVDFGTPVSGLAFTQFAIDAGVWVPYTSSFAVPEGLHTVRYQSQDNAGNLESVQTATVRMDATPPVTRIQIGTATYNGGSTIGIQPGTPVNLAATDALSGVSSTFWSIDGGAVQLFTANPLPITVSSGPHTLQAYSVDAVGNREAPELLTLRYPKDEVPPVTQIHYSKAPITNLAGVFITTTTLISLTAQDFGTPTSGVHFTQYSIDGHAFASYTAAFKLSEGAHTVRYFSQDNVDNIETVQTAAPKVDATPPISTLDVGDPKKKLVLGITMISAYTPLTVNAIDPNVGGASSGVLESWIAVDAQPYQRLSGSITLWNVRNGLHVIRYYSRDNMLNTEAEHQALVIVTPWRNGNPALGLHASGSLALPGTSDGSTLDISPAPVVVMDEETLTYHLELAPGWNAQTGFTSLSTQWDMLDPTALATLGEWAPDSGMYTVRLRTTDSNGQSADLGSVNTLDGQAQLSLAAHRAGVGSLTDFVQHSVFVYPNPARAGAKPTVHIEVGIADEVKIRIFDVAGRQVHEATLTGTPSIIDGQYAYEFLWDGSIPSGVYFYAVHAKKAGASDIKAQGKFAVVR